MKNFCVQLIILGHQVPGPPGALTWSPSNVSAAICDKKRDSVVSLYQSQQCFIAFSVNWSGLQLQLAEHPVQPNDTKEICRGKVEVKHHHHSLWWNYRTNWLEEGAKTQTTSTEINSHFEISETYNRPCFAWIWVFWDFNVWELRVMRFTCQQCGWWIDSLQRTYRALDMVSPPCGIPDDLAQTIYTDIC